MKKLIKIAIYGAIIFAVLVAATLFTLRKMYPPERLKKIAQNKAEQYLRRQINFEKISIGLSGLKMDSFEMSERPTFDKGTMLSAGHVSVMPKILSLLFGKMEIGKIKGQNINANLTRYKDGSFNFSDFVREVEAQKTAEKQTKRKKKDKKLDLVIGRLVLTDSNFTFTDNMLNSRMKILNLNLTAKNVSTKQAFELAAKLDADYDSPDISANIALETQALVNLSKPNEEMAEIKFFEIKNGKSVIKRKKGTSDDIKISNLNIKTQNASLKTPFEVSGALQVKYKLDVELTSNITSKIVVEPKGSKWNKSKVKILTLTADAGNISADIKGEIANLTEPKADLYITILPFDTVEIAKYLKNFTYKFRVPKTVIETKLKADKKMINISSLKIKPETSNITGSGVLLNKNGKWQLFKGASSFDIELANFASSSDNLKKYDLGGKLSGKIAVNQVRDKMRYNGDITLADIKARYAKNTITALNGYGKIETDEIRSSNISGKLNGSDFKTSLYAKMYNKKTKIDLDTWVDTVNLDLLLPEKNPAEEKTTKAGKKASQSIKLLDLIMSVKVDKITHPNFTGNDAFIKCNLVDFTPKLDQTSGTASFEIKNGRMQDLAQLAKRHNVAKALLIPLTTLQKVTSKVKLKILPDLDNIKYSIIEGNYRFTNGYMNIIKSQMISDAADVDATGGSNFRTDKLDMQIACKVKPSGITVRFNVKGKTTDPSVKFDVLSLLGKEKVKGVAETVTEEGKKLLQSLF